MRLVRPADATELEAWVQAEKIAMGIIVGTSYVVHADTVAKHEGGVPLTLEGDRGSLCSKKTPSSSMQRGLFSSLTTKGQTTATWTTSGEKRTSKSAATTSFLQQAVPL